MFPVLANERPGNKFHWEGTNTRTDTRTLQLSDLIGLGADSVKRVWCSDINDPIGSRQLTIIEILVDQRSDDTIALVQI